MSEVRYGPVIGDYRTVEFPVAASQMFHPNGAAFVCLNSSGHVTLALTYVVGPPEENICLFGWALVPRSLKGTDQSNGFWTSSATAGASKVPVIVAAMNPKVAYRVPCTAASAIAKRLGECSDLVGVNDGTVQYATPGTTDADVLLNVALPEDGDTNSIIVTINPNAIQRDTA